MTTMTIIAVDVKHWVLRHYLWVALILLLSTVATVVLLRPTDWKWLPIMGIPFTFLITVQKQKTEELSLFKQLFTEFNHRYDGLNAKLNAIPNEPMEKEIEGDERNLLFDYFNLCGEEYLFYEQGYIYPQVWKAWYNGMKIFRRNPRVKNFWDKELKNDSYYGLSFSDLLEDNYQAGENTTSNAAVQRPQYEEDDTNNDERRAA